VAIQGPCDISLLGLGHFVDVAAEGTAPTPPGDASPATSSVVQPVSLLDQVHEVGSYLPCGPNQSAYVSYRRDTYQSRPILRPHPRQDQW
jgi:hypothetical protein